MASPSKRRSRTTITATSTDVEATDVDATHVELTDARAIDPREHPAPAAGSRLASSAPGRRSLALATAASCCGVRLRLTGSRHSDPAGGLSCLDQVASGELTDGNSRLACDAGHNLSIAARSSTRVFCSPRRHWRTTTARSPFSPRTNCGLRRNALPQSEKSTVRRALPVVRKAAGTFRPLPARKILPEPWPCFAGQLRPPVGDSAQVG